MTTQRVRLSLHDHHERLRKAIDWQNKASQIKSNASVKIGDEKIQYFEKIALGSGATIAAVISFVGSKPEAIQRPNLLRWSLLLLVLTLATVLYRNWRYPFYTNAVWARHKAEADKQVEDLEADMFLDYPDQIPIDQNNQIIPIEQYHAQHLERFPMRLKQIENATQYENRVFREVQIVEISCLAFLFAAAVLLTTLIWTSVGVRQDVKPDAHSIVNKPQ